MGSRVKKENSETFIKKMKPVKTGNEPLSLNGQPTGHTLLNFWQWSASDILSNATRGVFAEFIVATALNIDIRKARSEWQAHDLTTNDGTKVEVKSAAYVQSWNQKKPSTITFSIKASRYWDSETNIQAKESKRQADVYVFCLLKHMDKETIDPLRLEQWEFYVLSTKELDNYKRSKHSITLKSLQKLTPAVGYYEIKEAIRSHMSR